MWVISENPPDSGILWDSEIAKREDDLKESVTGAVVSANVEALEVDGSQTQKSVELSKNARDRGNIYHCVHCGHTERNKFQPLV